MKQEQRLVAELFRYISPFYDVSKEFYVSLDGQAAIEGVKRDTFQDETIPDLWFSLVGVKGPVLLEAKIIKKKKILLTQAQLRKWKTSSQCPHKPMGWVAANIDFTEYYYWSHKDVLPSLDKSKSKQATLELKYPEKSAMKFKTVAELALHVLKNA